MFGEPEMRFLLRMVYKCKVQGFVPIGQAREGRSVALIIKWIIKR